MILYNFSFIASLLFLSVATYTDLKDRIVPNWLNYTYIASMLYFHLSYYIMNDYTLYLIASLIGGGLCFIVGVLMYRWKQWGGGDAKLLIGVGLAVGYPLRFLFILAFVGVAYILFWKYVVLRFTSNKTIPFVPAIYASYLLALLY